MPDRTRTFVALAVTVLVVLLGLAATRSRTPATTVVTGRTVGRITPAERAAGLTFAPDVAPYDRAVIAAAVARARPEARRLIAAVDGITDVEVAPAAGGAVGTTQRVGDRFHVVLDLGSAARAAGRRGLDRLVLHELGHVVDGALVPDDLRDRMAAEVTGAYGCRGGDTGACTTPAEVWAESFAKWATGDIGVNLNLGYAVPPPGDLEHWGAPLARLGG